LDSWRTPLVVLISGCLISMIGFGPRATLGFFLTPMSHDQGWGREVFALSVAIQTPALRRGPPFSGAIADRFGTVRVIIAGTLLYAAGIFMMAHASTPETLFLSSGVLIRLRPVRLLVQSGDLFVRQAVAGKLAFARIRRRHRRRLVRVSSCSLRSPSA
jgi:MFS family permease